MTIMSRKFTKAIKLDSNVVEIEYVKWFKTKRIRLNRSDIQTKIGSGMANRAGTASITLSFLTGTKVLYRVDTNDGFEEDDLREFAAKVSDIKPM